MTSVEPADPDSQEAQDLLAALSASLEAITGASGQASFERSTLADPRSAFLVARDGQGNAIGCGALRPLDTGTCEIKRMFAARGRSGTGSAILGGLESRARELGFERIVLETRRVNEGAVAFYRSHGYREIPNYGRYVGRSEAICFAKSLGDSVPGAHQSALNNSRSATI